MADVMTRASTRRRSTKTALSDGLGLQHCFMAASALGMKFSLTQVRDVVTFSASMPADVVLSPDEGRRDPCLGNSTGALRLDALRRPQVTCYRFRRNPPSPKGAEGVRGQKKVCVPKIGLKFPAPLIISFFARGQFF